MAKLSIDHEVNEIKSSEEINANQSQTVAICQICRLKESLYKCPKCKINYCSIDCYKNHNNDCTEEFYKDNIISELKATRATEEESSKFRKNLKEVYDKLNQSSPDEFNDDADNIIEMKKGKHYEEILDKINSNTFNIESDLTPTDWNEFNDFLYSKDKKQYGALYFPFWLRDEIPSVYVGDINALSLEEINGLKQLELNDYVTYYDDDSKEIENDELSSDDEDSIDVKTITLNSKTEAIDYNIINKSLYIKYQEVKELAQLTKTQPAKDNIYQLIIVIYTTVYLFRLFNGEFRIENDIEVIDYMIQICPLLHDKTPFTFCSSVQTATNYFVANIKQIEHQHLKQTMGVILTDTMTLISRSKSYVFESLVRLYEIIHKFGKNSNKSTKAKITSAKYKILYLMSYFKSLNSNVYNESIQIAFTEFYSNPLISK